MTLGEFLKAARRDQTFFHRVDTTYWWWLSLGKVRVIDATTIAECPDYVGGGRSDTGSAT